MNLGMPEMMFILLLALVVVGPRRLPELARQMGKYLAEFKRASNEFKNQLETEMLNMEMEERSKKGPDEPKVLPPDEPWERLMRPLTDTVSRARNELVSLATSDHQAPASAPPPASIEPPAPVKPAGNE
jgi:Tat protein translocase TatB subunit